nr:hypothetical protein [uncultured Merdimonas sp.]
MLKPMGKNKKYILGMAAVGLFGMAGLLLAPIAIYMIKLSNQYPKVFRWIIFILFAFMCIYGLLVEQDEHMNFVIIIGAVIVVSSVLNIRRK